MWVWAEHGGAGRVREGEGLAPPTGLALGGSGLSKAAGAPRQVLNSHSIPEDSHWGP